MAKIHSFGCSFSTKCLLPKDKFWLDILAHYYHVEYDSWGSGASEFHEAFHRLTGVMKDFKKDDLVIFQFTDHNRLGVIENQDYITTAMLGGYGIEDTLHKIKFYKKVHQVNKTEEDFLLLFNFANKWLKSQMFWNYWRVWNTLKFLEETIGIHFILLFLDDTWKEVIEPEHYHNIPLYPTPTVKNNISLARFCWDNRGYAVGHDLNYKNNPRWHSKDGHPSELGSVEMVKRITQHINQNWSETNPYKSI